MLPKTEGRDSTKCPRGREPSVKRVARGGAERDKFSRALTKGRFVGSGVLPHQAKLLRLCPVEFTWGTSTGATATPLRLHSENLECLR